MFITSKQDQRVTLSAGGSAGGCEENTVSVRSEYQDLTVDIAVVTRVIVLEKRQTPSTLCTRCGGSQNRCSDVSGGLFGLISEFKNEILTGISQIVLSLLTNPNRGLNAFLGDVTVAIGGF
jgi:hypothetical protein